MSLQRTCFLVALSSCHLWLNALYKLLSKGFANRFRVACESINNYLGVAFYSCLRCGYRISGCRVQGLGCEIVFRTFRVQGLGA